ncbi:MarR family winged helix-turn-helix transcriptional regulator [Secundilactobacillus kimchicus]|uniref:MarR family winged helix-turn-helix transcriptional regulator n=1 Tax=Secundilactobacillus kimchicus TaxID=528209 RepID=UPI000704DEF3|nr:MarR family transcriptional regulator [Secundilactobacillus kimchicus]
MNTTLTRLRHIMRAFSAQRATFQRILANRLTTNQNLSPTVQQQLKKANLNHSQIEILSLVSQESELAYKALTDKVSFSQGMLSRYVARLVKLQLLEKVPLVDNKKAYNLKATDTGRFVAKAHDTLHQEEDAQLAAALTQFSPRELHTTLKVLEALADVNLENESANEI